MFTQVQPQTLISVLIFALALYLRSWIRWRSRTGGARLPPGPRGLPLVGNLFNAPKSKPWIGYRDLSLIHGNIVHVNILGQHMVALNTADVIDELLEKRSAITSDRKDSILVDLTGHDMTFTFHPHGQRWRQHRRMFWQHFTARAVLEYRDVQRNTARRFLALLLKDSSHFKEHIRYTFASSILKIIYDIDAAEKDDQYISKVDATLEGLSQGLVPGKYMVEFLPFLRHLPAWVPGAGFQKDFARWRAAGLALKNEPFAYVKQSLDRGNANHSVVGRLLTTGSGADGTPAEDVEDVIKNVAVIAIEGGSDTTFSALQTVFLAISLHPEVMDKAHAELDAVVGPHRLPDFDDRDGLVYVNALIKEALRWYNVVPLSIPHRMLKDDEFHGYFIPEGTLLLPNIWACMHDPEVYVNPDEFHPERFIRDGKLDPSIRDPVNFVFGFGRRICPGRHFAEDSLFINVASVLHTFDITPPLDEHEQPIKVVPDMTDGLLSYPENVQCIIKPRSPEAASLIMGHEALAALCT
ncbi:cytochrome P450 [Lentinus tigrinus ALCF2SS1-7]|uniref:Cytochrome P450 n=1 Tax=Lentinus tigrinus ALCF2SS1-6 TaxID=1328759 RepID=A0A5C2SCU8_9APHY|nr:cytochrome P450 [Lentinus tigrinus ALCF2SS1-6]RPD76146.1 cytochrome P450 [Lentinus tigrinus ALCF2SS1-7]